MSATSKSNWEDTKNRIHVLVERLLDENATPEEIKNLESELDELTKEVDEEMIDVTLVEKHRRD